MRLIHIVSSGSFGGKEQYALDICRHFASQGDSVTVLTRDARAVDCRFEMSGISLRHAPLRDYPDFFSTLILRRLLEEDPQRGKGAGVVIHVHRYRDALTAIAARRLAGMPLVKVVVTRHKALPGRNTLIRRWIYRQLDSQVFVSEFSKNLFLSAWPTGRYPFDSRRLHVTLNSRLTAPEPVEEPKRGAVTAMYHGRVQAGKGLETLLTALHLVRGGGGPRIRLRVVGCGEADYVDSLRSLAVRLGVMDLIDWVRPAGDPSELISECHFGVLPAERPEAFGMANMEYMMNGRPQVTTFNGAQGEYLTADVEALRVEPGDAEGLAAAMSRLAEDSELRRQIGLAARRRYDSALSWPHFIAALSEAYGL